MINLSVWLIFNYIIKIDNLNSWQLVHWILFICTITSIVNTFIVVAKHTHYKWKIKNRFQSGYCIRPEATNITVDAYLQLEFMYIAATIFPKYSEIVQTIDLQTYLKIIQICEMNTHRQIHQYYITIIRHTYK